MPWAKICVLAERSVLMAVIKLCMAVKCCVCAVSHKKVATKRADMVGEAGHSSL